MTSVSVVIPCYRYGHFLREAVDSVLEDQEGLDVRVLIIDDASNGQNPDPIVFARGNAPVGQNVLTATNTLRGGDTVEDAVGVLTYTWGGNAASPNDYRLRPIGALGGAAEFKPANPRPVGAPAVGGTLQVASSNLLNYFNTFSGCTFNRPSAVAETSATIENGTLIPFLRVPRCTSWPPSNDSRRSDRAAPL